jgi:hypothetical protein
VANAMLSRAMQFRSSEKADSVEFDDDQESEHISVPSEGTNDAELLEKVFDVKHADVLHQFSGCLVSASLLPAKFLITRSALHVFASFVASCEPKSGFLSRMGAKRWFVLDVDDGALCVFK